MNYNRQFDEHIKEQFGNYSPDVPPRIWENIIAKTERRKPVGFWISLFGNKNRLLLLGLLIVIGTGATLLYKNTGLINSNTQIADEKNKGTGKEQTGLTKNEVQGNNTSLEQAPLPAGGTSIGIYTPTLSADEEQNTATNNYSNNVQQKKAGQSAGSLNMNIQSPDLNDDEFLTGGTTLGRLTFGAELYTADQRTKKRATLSFNPIIYLPGCPSIEKDAAGNKKYFEFYAGPDYAFQSLSDTGNSVYLQKRKESTTFKSAFSAGVRFTKVFNNSMSVRAGVNYSQINEKFTFTQGNLVQITYIIDAHGDTVGSYTTTGTRYKTTINRYRSIDVPIVAGYEIGNGKLHANLNAGVIINIYSWQKGDILDQSGNPVDITTGKSSSPYQFKTNAGLGFIGAVSVYYKLTDRMHVMAEPYFRYNLSQMNKENITLKQKYHTAGLRLGIRLDLR